MRVLQFFAVLVFLLCRSFVCAQPVELLDFDGIAFGSSEMAVKKALLEKGAKFKKSSVNKVSKVLYFDKVNAFSISPESSAFYFKHGKFFCCTFIYLCGTLSSANELFERLRDSLDAKWIQQKEKQSEYTDMYQQYLLSKNPGNVLNFMKVHPDQLWRNQTYSFPISRPPCNEIEIMRNEIELYITQDLMVVLRYKDFCLLETGK